jgi:hypothetical protein
MIDEIIPAKPPYELPTTEPETPMPETAPGPDDVIAPVTAEEFAAEMEKLIPSPPDALTADERGTVERVRNEEVLASESMHDVPLVILLADDRDALLSLVARLTADLARVTAERDALRILVPAASTPASEGYP